MFDGMLVSIRLIYKTKKKMKEIQERTDGHMEEKDVLELVDWILKSYQRSGVQVDATDMEQLRHKILSSFEDAKDGLLSIRDLATLFESVMEKKRWFHSLNKVVVASPTPNKRATNRRGSVAKRRVSVHTFTDISEAELAALGITPLVREKFDALAVDKKGLLALSQVIELLQWMYMGRPNDTKTYCTEFEQAWEEEFIVSTDYLSLADYSDSGLV